MIYEMNEIFIRRKHKMIREIRNIEPKTISIEILATCLKNLESLGYTFSEKMIKDVLSTYIVDEIITFHDNMSQILAKLSGANKVYIPMYPNFPKQVMDASNAELYINAVLHYFGRSIGERIIPHYEKEYRSPLLEKTTLTVIDLGTIEEFHQMFTDLMSSKTSISEQDKEDLMNYLEFFAGHKYVKFPETFNHKEVFAFVAQLAIERGIDHNWEAQFKTATDVLRFATALSDGDISLASNTKFISFSRSLRKFMLKTLATMPLSSLLEDMKRYSNKWKRLGERLHPGEYKTRHPHLFVAFTEIRNDEKIETFNSKLEKELQSLSKEGVSNLNNMINSLKSRPGIFARRLDHVLRSVVNIAVIVKAFAEVAEQVSTPVLLQVANHFKYRDVRGSEHRIFFPKGNVAKMQVVPNDLKPLPYSVCNSIDLICQQALWNKFQKLPPLGKVYVDPALETYNVPFSQRSASNATRTLVRGSRILLDESKNTIRFFMWWTDLSKKQEKNTSMYDNSNPVVDLDLSAIMYDKNFQKISHISYTHLRENYAYHSGDLTSAPNGAAEFIDVNIDKLISQGGRYVAMNVYSYSGQKFSDVECFAGWMEREHVQSGEIFEPKTVKQRFDMTADTKTTFPLIIDLKNREVIWCDLSVTSKMMKGGRNVESNVNTMAILLNAIVKWKKPNLFDLFTLHASARGELVDNIEYADFVFSTELKRRKYIVSDTYDGPEESIKTIPTDITPLDIEKIMSEFL